MTMYGGYRINDATLQELKALGFPEAQLQIVRESIIDGYFDSDRALQQSIKELLGDSIGSEQLEVISSKAKRFRFQRLLNLIFVVRDFYIPRSKISLPLFDYLSIMPTVLLLRQRSRFFWFWLCSKLRGRDLIAAQKNTNDAGFIHNYKQMLDFSYGHRNRTERLMNALRNIDNVDFGNSKSLVIGPRNESEILMLRAYGFKKLSVIDLFSYSPVIQPMDMNQLEFGDNAFDIYYSSAVIKYSTDIKTAVSEAVRVTKNGGIMAFCFMYGSLTDLIPAGSELSGGVRDLLDLFGDHVDHIYWHEEYVVTEQDIRAAVIFRIRK